MEQEKANMAARYEHEIPEGYEARIDSNKVIIELKESEDEKIRTRLIALVESFGQGTYKNEMLAYLEKQKVQQPAKWSDNFEENIRILLNDKLTWHSEDGSMSSTVLIDDKTLKDIISGIWFYVGKEALKYPSKELNVSEWSEEDEKMRLACIDIIEHFPIPSGTVYGPWGDCINWLKSLRPQSHWKPSEYTLSLVKKVADGEMLTGVDQMAMVTLYEQLKKL